MIPTTQTVGMKLKAHIMRKKHREEQAKKEFEGFEKKHLRHKKEREENLTELNKLREQVSTLEKEVFEFKEIRVQLGKELDVVNKQLIEVQKMKEDNDRNTQAMKENAQTIEENMQEREENTSEIKEKAEEENTQEIEENTPEVKKEAEEDKKCFNYPEAALQNTVINNAPLFRVPVYLMNPAEITATNSVLPAIPSNRNQFTDHKATLQTGDFTLSPLYADVFMSKPVKTSTDSILPVIPSNRNHKAVLQNVHSSLHVDVVESESQSSTPANLLLSTVNRKPLPKNEEVKEHYDHKDEFDGRQTNLHASTHLLVPLGNMSDDSDQHTLPSKKPVKKGKSKSQKQATLKTPNIRVINLQSLKENRDINKQNVYDANSIETQQLPQDVRRGGITSHYPYPRPNYQLPPNRHPFTPMYPGVNVNLQNRPMFYTYPNHYVRSNFVPSSTCTNQTPSSFPPVCVDTFHTNPYLPPIYTMPHAHPSFSRTSVSTPHVRSPFFPPTYTNTSRMTPALSLPPHASTSCTNPDPSIVTSHAKPSDSINHSRKRPSAVNPPVASANTSHTNTPSSHSFIGFNTSRANQAFLPPITGSSNLLVNPPLPSIIYSTSHVNPPPSVIQSDTSYSKPSPSIDPPSRKRSYPYSTPISSSLPVTNTYHVNSPMPLTWSTTSRINPSPSVIQNISIPSHTDSSSYSSDVVIIDPDSSCAYPAPLPPIIITCSSVSTVKPPSPSITDLTCSTASCVNPSSVTQSNTTCATPLSLQSAIRISLTPVNPPSSLSS